MNILITGGLGFIGSNFYNTFKEKYPDYNLLILDSETYAADEKNIHYNNARIIKFSITERERLFKLFENYKFDSEVLSQGTYVITLTDDSGKFYTTRIIK